MAVWGRAVGLCAVMLTAGAWAQTEVERRVIELQMDEDWGSPAQQWIDGLEPSRTAELIPLLGRIKRWHAMSIVAKKLANDQVDAAIPELIETLAKRYPERRNEHPAFESLKAFGWKAIGPLIRALDSNDFSTQWNAALLLGERCRFEPADGRLLPVMRRLARSSSPSMSRAGTEGLQNLAFRISGGWMGEVPVEYAITSQEALGDLIDVFLAGPNESMLAAEDALEKFIRWAPVEGEHLTGRLSDSNVARKIAVDDRYLGHAMPEVRMVVLASLARADMVGMAHIAGLGDMEEGVRQTAVKALMLKFEPAWVVEVAKHLQATSPAVRAAAAKALGLSYQPSAATILRDYLDDANPGVQASVRAAIDRIEGRGLMSGGG